MRASDARPGGRVRYVHPDTREPTGPLLTVEKVVDGVFVIVTDGKDTWPGNAFYLEPVKEEDVIGTDAWWEAYKKQLQEQS